MDGYRALVYHIILQSIRDAQSNWFHSTYSKKKNNEEKQKAIEFLKSEYCRYLLNLAEIEINLELVRKKII